MFFISYADTFAAVRWLSNFGQKKQVLAELWAHQAAPENFPSQLLSDAGSMVKQLDALN